MQKIIIGFSKSVLKFAPMAKIIMLCEHSNYSHAYVKIYSKGIDRMLIYQATGSGVFFIGEEGFSEHSKPVEEYEIDITDEAKIKLLQWAIDTSGKPYGRLSCLGLGIKRLFRLFGFKIKNPFNDGNKAYICCELVAQALSEIGKPVDNDPNEIDLVDLRNWVRDMCLPAELVIKV